MSVIDTAEILLGRKLSDEEYLQAAVLGWGVEMVCAIGLSFTSFFFLISPKLQAFFLVSDDLMDSSITRRGQPCWYRVPKIGFIAMNDSFMLEAAIYHLLKVHFKKEPYYVDLIELFHEVTYQTEMGQLIDLITAPENDIDLNRFSLKK